MSRFKKMVFLAAVVAATAVSSVRADSIVTNGYFETTAPVDSVGYSDIGPGNTLLPGWTVTGSIDVVSTYWNTPLGSPTGAQSIDLDGVSAGSISQQLTGLTSGDTYQLNFDVAANSDGLPLTKELAVTLTPPVNSTTYSPTNMLNSAQASNGNVGNLFPGATWLEESIDFTPVFSPGGAETLTFASLDNVGFTAFGPVIADVSVSQAQTNVTAVPLPASAGVGFSMLAGFGVLASIRRKLASRSRIA